MYGPHGLDEESVRLGKLHGGAPIPQRGSQRDYARIQSTYLSERALRDATHY